MIEQLKGYLGYNPDDLEYLSALWQKHDMDRFQGAEFSPDNIGQEKGQEKVLVHWPEPNAYIRFDLACRSMQAEFIDLPGRAVTHTRNLEMNDPASWSLLEQLLGHYPEATAAADGTKTGDTAAVLEEAIREAALRMAEAAGPAAARKVLLKIAESLLLDCLQWETLPGKENTIRTGYNAGYGMQFHAEVEYNPQTKLHYWILLHEGRGIESSGGYTSSEQAKRQAIEALKRMLQPQI